VVVSDEEAKDADGGADIELAEREEHLTEDWDMQYYILVQKNANYYCWHHVHVPSYTCGVEHKKIAFRQITRLELRYHPLKSEIHLLTAHIFIVYARKEEKK
jgi:hypothetical protein